MELEDEWRCSQPCFNPFGPESPNDEWTGWTQFELKEREDDKMEELPAPAVKRKAEGEHDEEDQPAAIHRQLSEGSGDNMADVSEITAGLTMMGFNPDVVDWFVNSDLDVLPQLNEIRRMVRLHGKG